MCCFSGPVEKVADTKIFARGTDNGRQYVVYEMKFESKAEVAMILPLPVAPKSLEHDVRFIDLSEYSDFFQDMERGFPRPDFKTRSLPRAAAGGFGDSPPKLAVVEVGEFEASFVPTVNDFNRLDERFRLSTDTWEKSLPQYRDWGFAVFKLKPGHRKVHPMAFNFPRRKRDQTFFPTVHIHDGEVHDVAEFDHVLYLQLLENPRSIFIGWDESSRPAEGFMRIEKAKSVVAGRTHVYRRELRGKFKNRDVLV